MTYNSNVNNQRNSDVSDVNEVVFNGINSFIETQSKGPWVGTMTELKTVLKKVLPKKERAVLPGSPGALRVVVDRVVRRLRNRGIGVRFGRTTDHSRTRFVRFAF